MIITAMNCSNCNAARVCVQLFARLKVVKSLSKGITVLVFILKFKDEVPTAFTPPRCCNVHKVLGGAHGICT